MRVWCPGEVQAVGVGELVRIAIGSAEERQDALALPDTVPAQIKILRGNPRRQLDRAVPAQQLFDGRLDQLWLLAEEGELLPMPEERQGAVRDQVDGGLVSCDEQEIRHHHELALGQDLPRPLAREQTADQVLAGVQTG